MLPHLGCVSVEKKVGKKALQARRVEGGNRLTTCNPWKTTLYLEASKQSNVQLGLHIHPRNLCR